MSLTLGWGLAQAFEFTPRQAHPLPHTARSGLDTAGADVKAMQADEWANPAQAWLQKGAQLWARSSATAPSCGQCHGALEVAMKGVAPRSPAWSARLGRVGNLEDQIRHCQSVHQKRVPDEFESEDLLALSASITRASKGLPMSQRFVPEEREALTRGESEFHRRQGLLNLACAHCHQDLAGKRLLMDPLSQGQPNAYPLYRLEWQSLGSLERRLRSCLNGVKSELDPWGSARMRDLALYLRWRAQGLAIEMPAVRK